jgi:purine-nucleoside phosphorylase
MSSAFEKLSEAARRQPPQVAVILGSGLGGIGERVTPRHDVDYSGIPAWPPTSVAGHRGRLVFGDWAGHAVLVFAGRLHFYEGHTWDQVLAAVRLAADLGVRQLFFTNAAGGIREDLKPGTLMAICDQLDWTRPGLHCTEFQRPTPYSPHLRKLLAGVARQQNIHLAEGSYAAVLGPNYETPAEIRALRSLGVDAVGMSTAREIQAGVGLGLECAAVSCITNRAAGLSATRLTHEEVLANSQKQAARLGDLIESFLAAV